MTPLQLKIAIAIAIIAGVLLFGWCILKAGSKCADICEEAAMREDEER